MHLLPADAHRRAARRYVNDYVRENFRIVQIDLWGSREATDFDGKVMSEKKLAERWGVLFTPTVVFFKDDLKGLEGQFGPPLEVARMQLGIGAATYDMFVWIKARIYERTATSSASTSRAWRNASRRSAEQGHRERSSTHRPAASSRAMSMRCTSLVPS